MKKLLFISLALFTFLTVNAQYSTSSTDKKWDRFVLGGTVNFHFRDGGRTSLFSNSSKGYDFRPYFGKVISDRWIVGLELSIGQTQSERIDFDRGSGIYVIQRELNAAVELFGRYTLNPSNRLQFYIRPYARYSHYANKIDKLSINEHRNTLNLGLDAGLIYQVSKRINLTANLANLNVSRSSFGGPTGINNTVDLNLDPSNIKFGAEIKF